MHFSAYCNCISWIILICESYFICNGCVFKQIYEFRKWNKTESYCLIINYFSLKVAEQWAITINSLYLKKSICVLGTIYGSGTTTVVYVYIFLYTYIGIYGIIFT